MDFQGSFAWQCHNQLCDNYGCVRGRRRIGTCIFFVLIIVGLFGVQAPLPFHPSLTTATYTTITTTTTVKLIVFQYDTNTVVTGTISTAAGIQMPTRSYKT